MDKQSIKDAIAQYARRGHSTQADVWPGVQAALRNMQPTQAQDLPQRHARPQAQVRSKRLRLAIAPGIVVVALLIAAALFAGVQAPRSVSAEEILSRTQAAATNPMFNSFHGIKVSRDNVEGQSSTGRMEEWYQAPRHYCYDLVVTSRTVARTARCVSGTQGTWYMSSWDLAMLRDYASLPFGDAASLDDVTSGQMADLYDREVLGTEEIQGRTAWIVDITLKSTHPSSGPKASAITIAHKRIWVDQEAFFVLKMLIWDRKNDLISTNEYESFEINTRISPEVFNYSPPQDALVADLHSTQNEANRVQLWQHVAQRANFPVQMGPSRLPDLDAGNPNIDMRTGVVTSAYYSQKTGGSPFLGLVVAQGPVSALPVKGEGYNVAQEGIQARFYPAAEGRDYTSLVVDRGGIRTVVRNYQHEGRSGAEWTLYRNLTAVPSR